MYKEKRMNYRPMPGRIAAALAVTALLLAPRAQITRAAPTVTLYQLTDLGTLGGAYSSPRSINNVGQITGFSEDGAGDFHAFLWRDGVMQDLGTLAGAGFNSFGIGINANGEVTGPSDTPSASDAFLWRQGVMTDLGTLGGATSSGNGINASHQVAGYSNVITLDPTNPGAQEIHALLWSGGTLSDLGTLGTGPDSDALAINDPGQVTGWTTIDTGFDPETFGPDYYAFLWQHGVMTNLGTLPGGNYSQGNDLNNRGQVAGYSETGTLDPADASCGNPPTFHEVHAALWQTGMVSDLPPFAGDPDALAFGLNNQGQVVGRSGTACNSTGAALWQNGVVTDLNAVIPAGSGWFLDHAFAINDRGQITGSGALPDGSEHAFLLTPVGQGLPHAVDRQAEARAQREAQAQLAREAQVLPAGAPAHHNL
jgi:probable HAF family extracellular repeat protein